MWNAGSLPWGYSADETGHVQELAEEGEFGSTGLLGEKLIEFSSEFVAASHEGHEAGGVVLYVPGVDPRITFGEPGAAALTAAQFGIEAFHPVAVGGFGRHEAGAPIEEVGIVAGALQEVSVVVLFAESFGHLGETPIVVVQFSKVTGERPDDARRDAPPLTLSVSPLASAGKKPFSR